MYLCRFLGAAKQKLAHRFLLRVAAYYKEKQKPANFIPELLQLGVDGLFSVQLTDWGQPSIDDQQAAADFENDLREYIYENKLKSSLISQTKKLMVIAILIMVLTFTLNVCVYALLFPRTVSLLREIAIRMLFWQQHTR